MAEPPDNRTKARRPWAGIRPRLIGVLVVPTIAALAFGALQMQEAVQRSSQAAQAESVSNALPDSFRLGVQLTVERDAGSSALPAAQLRKVWAATDEQIATWREFLPQIDYSGNEALRRDLTSISESLDQIETLRQEIADPESRDDARKEYTDTANSLLGLSSRVPTLDDADIFEQTYALDETAGASEALGEERIVVGKALESGELGKIDRARLIRAQSDWVNLTSKFYNHTSPAAQDAFEEATNHTPLDGGSRAPMQETVNKLIVTGDPGSLNLTSAEWLVQSAEFVRQVEDVIVQAAEDIDADVTQLREEAQREAILTAVFIFVVLFLALLIAGLAARSILRPLGRLRQAALEIAQHELPERVRRLETGDVQDDLGIDPIGVARRDEIGEVADAFDAVHAEAVRLAGEQAQMRANVNRMFVNLSRRSQSLVERQLRLIDELEASEQNPDDLANLFRLDHLATRMRRNDESLLVLAGGDLGHAARGDVPVLDVLRAAASEIEQFARVEVRATEGLELNGRVAGDLVHLLAELIENATNFSPPDTPVVVEGHRDGPDGELVIEVSDLGIGLTPGELEAANAKLQRTAGLDADVARMMGLVVTGRLAQRHGLSVELHPNSPRGVVARVEVPVSALPGAATAALTDGTTDWTAGPSGVPAEVGSRSVPAPQPLSAAASSEDAWFDATAPFGTAGPAAAAAHNGTAHNGTAHDTAANGHPLGALPTSPLPQRRPGESPRPGQEQPGQERPGGWAQAPEPLPSTGSNGSLGASRDAEDPLTAELPAVGAEQASSPIFTDLQSEWFTRRTPGGARRRSAPSPDTTRGSAPLNKPMDPLTEPMDSPAWRSPGDEGWRRAAELSEQLQPAAVTADGLPKRVPGQNLIPGSAPSEAPIPAAQRRPDKRRTGGLSSFQQGVSRARGADPLAPDHRPEGGDQ